MITTEMKKEIIAKYGKTPEDTGSPEVQIALLTARISDLTEHLKVLQKRSSEDGWSEKRITGLS
mgnify:CR=1 FL=1